MDQPSTSETESAQALPLEIESAQAPPEIESAQATAANADSSQEVAPDDDECVSRMELPVYKAATTGDTAVLGLHRERLSQIVTPTENTVLHIYIACAIRSQTDDDSANVDTVREILRMCPALLLQPNKRGDTILHTSARHGHGDIVQHLIDAAKARPEDGSWSMLIRTTNNDKDTALHEAVRFNHLHVVRILTKEDHLFSYSANAAGQTPLYMAVERGYGELVSEILKTCSRPTYEGSDGRTALHAAVIYNDEESTSKLLAREGALAKAVDKLGWTPLHYAALIGHSSIVNQLLRSDKSAAYIRDKIYQRTALHNAAFGGHIDVMKELISHCPDCCELVDTRDQNVLHYAIKNKKFQVQDFVREDPWLSNVLLNGKDENQNTPFHQLAASSHKIDYLSRAGPAIVSSSMDLISDARVDKMAFNKKNLTALDMIQDNDTFSPLEKKYLRRLSVKMNSGRLSYPIVNKEVKGNGEEETKIERNKATDQIVKELKQSHLVVATLIATVTFTAGLAMPGGYQSLNGPDRGLAVLSKSTNFRVFILTNTLAMTLSTSAVLIHLWIISIARNYRPFLQIRLVLHLTVSALIFMMYAFYTGISTVLGHSAGSLLNGCLTTLGLLMIPLPLLFPASMMYRAGKFYLFSVYIRQKIKYIRQKIKLVLLKF